VKKADPCSLCDLGVLLVTVENQTVFESLLYESLAETSVVVFTAGYLGAVQRNWIAVLVGAGVRRVRHWGDLDPWGLDIYRDLRDWLGGVDADVVVEPWRVEPEPLERADAQKLSSEDWVKLHRYLARDGAAAGDGGGDAAVGAEVGAAGAAGVGAWHGMMSASNSYVRLLYGFVRASRSGETLHGWTSGVIPGR
jgi:hypothetical protein